MGTQFFARRAIRALAAFLLLLVASNANAASILWGPATLISGDSDVSTSGTLLGAFNMGSSGISSTTVNGVTFNALGFTGSSVTSGNFKFDITPVTFSSGSSFGSASAPFANLSSSYKTLLSSAAGGIGDPVTLTMSALTAGRTYQFEWWSNNSAPAFSNTSTATAGNTVSLQSNTTVAQGGLGQFAIGTFTADATTQNILFAGTGPLIDGLQLRDTTPVPAPSSAQSGAVLLTILAITFALRRYGQRNHKSL